MPTTVTLNTKVSEEDRDKFAQTAESLGMNSSTALKVFVKKFIDYGGFPFEVAASRSTHASYLPGTRIPVAGVIDSEGHTVLPAEEDNEEDDIYDRYYAQP
jgi:DNA-damage-inducible protein J